MKNNKKAALEMSMNTIIVIVLGVSMLILGMVLIRNIMCSGLQITNDVSAGVRNEIKTLFSSDNLGVKCMGEGSQEINLATGGQRKVICLIKVQESKHYTITATNIQSLKGAPQSSVDKWALNKVWTGDAAVGTDNEADFLLLDIPQDAPTTTLRVTIQIDDGSGSPKTTTSTLNIVPAGFIRGAIC